MKVYLIEEYDKLAESSNILRVCKRKEVAEYFIKRFKNADNSRLPLELQDFYYSYGIMERTLIE